MATWQSNPIAVDGVEVQVQASVEGVTLGKSVDGVYASDLLLTAEQTDALIAVLAEGKVQHLAARRG
jgi:hypothetical protein